MGGFRPSPSAVAGPSQAGTVTSDLHQITGSVEITGSLEVNGVSITGGGGGGGGGGSVAGSNTQVQFNDSGDFGASSNLTFTGGNTLNAANVTASAHLRSPKIGVGANATSQALYVSGETRLEGTTYASHIPLGGGAENVFLRPGTSTGNVIMADSHQDMMVGIGTGAPTAKLHVSSSHPTEPLFRVDHSTQAGTPPQPIFYITGSGLVGIGTDSPRTDASSSGSPETNRLHILGEYGADQGVNPVVNTLLMLENNDHAGIQFMVPAQKAGQITWGTADGARKATYYYDSNYNVYTWEGTSYGGSRAMQLAAGGDCLNIGGPNANHMSNSPPKTEANLHISSSTHGIDKGGPVMLKIDHGEKDKQNILYVTGSGRVGINTNSPAQDLDVADDTDASARIGRAHIGYNGTRADAANFAHRDHVSDSAYALQQRHTGETVVNAPSGQNVSLRVAGNNALVVAGALGANIGINMSNPTARLHISASSGEKDVLRVDGDSAAVALYVSGSGRVGIGTSNPLAKLHVSSSQNAQQLSPFSIQCAGSGSGGNVADDFMFCVTGSAINQNVVYIGALDGESVTDFADLQVDQNIFLNDGHFYMGGGNPSVRSGNSRQRLTFNTSTEALDLFVANNRQMQLRDGKADITGSLDITGDFSQNGVAQKRTSVYTFQGAFTGAASPQFHHLGELPAGAIITDAYLDVTGAFTATAGASPSTFIGIGTETTYNSLGANAIIGANPINAIPTNSTGTIDLTGMGASTSGIVSIKDGGSGLVTQYPMRKLPSTEAVLLLVFDQGGGSNGITSCGAKLYLEYLLMP